MKKIILLFALIAALLMAAPAFAGPPYFINGTVNRSDTMAGLSGVAVALNITNTTTTNASGAFSFSNITNGTASLVITAPNTGYTGVSYSVVINGADNTTAGKDLALVTPTISGTAASSIGRTGAVISWTPSIVDVGNRVIYTKDSALTNNLVTSDWSNSTTSPSFTLKGLDVFSTYYYQAQSYNSNNATYSVTANGNFKTLAGMPDEEENGNYELVAHPSAPSSGLPQLPVPSGNSNTTKVIIFGVVIVLLYMVLFGTKKR